MDTSLKVCGIDPGTEQTALVIWNGKAVLDKRLIPNQNVIDYLATVSCAAVACEHMQCYGMAVGKEVFETCYWIGKYWEVCDLMGLEWQRVYRSDVKSYWCHSPRASDSNVHAAIVDRLGAPGRKKTPGVTYGITKDLWSALAIAVRTHDLKTGVIAP